jgi:hypothetical protein
MAELFKNLGSVLPNMGNLTTRNYVPSGAGFNLMTLVYVGLIVLVIFVIVLMLMGKKIDLSWLDPRPKRMVVTSDAHLFWKPSALFTNLTVPEKSIPEFLNTLYSISFDIVLQNTRNFKGTGGPWRHIVHRGSDELAQSTIGGAIMRASCAAANGSGPLPPFGLPKRMNPGIFLDPNINDLIIFIDTERGGDSYRESVRIKDIPMDIPFRIQLIINERLLEIYLNCRLEVSKVLSGRPRSVEDVWYGLSGSAAAQAMIQNLYIWKRPLSADSIGALCLVPPVFANIRPVCDGTPDSVTKMKINGGTSSPSITFGNSLSSCPTN